MPTKTKPSATSTFQLPGQYAHLPALVANYRATFGERNRLGDLLQNAEAQIAAYATTGSMDDPAALGSIGLKQTLVALLPARLAHLDAELAQTDGELGTLFTGLRASMRGLAQEVRRGHCEVYAQGHKDGGMPLEIVRRQAWDNLPKSKEVAGYEAFLGQFDNGADYAGSVDELLARLESWTRERDALAAQLGGTIPDAYTFNGQTPPAPVVLTYGGREVGKQEFAELNGEEGRTRR